MKITSLSNLHLDLSNNNFGINRYDLKYIPEGLKELKNLSKF